MGITNGIDIFQSSSGEAASCCICAHFILIHVSDLRVTSAAMAAGSLDLLTSNNDDVVRCFSAETFQEKWYATPSGTDPKMSRNFIFCLDAPGAL